MSEPRRLSRRLVLQALVSAGLLAFLAWKVPLRAVGAALLAFPVSGLALSLAVIAAQLVTGALRWRRMLARTGARVKLSALLDDVLVGSAYNMILPSSVGGDVIRAIRCGRRLTAPHHAWSTALFERMVGVPTLALVAAPGIAIVPGGGALVLPTLVIAAVGLLALVFAGGPLRWLATLLTARSPAAADVSRGMAEDLAGPLGTRGARAEAFAWSVVYQLLGISILAACVLPMGNRELLVAIYAGVPLIVVLAMLPVSIAGIGVRESLFVVVLGRLGVSEPTALALAMLWLGSYVVLAVPGMLLEWRAPKAETTP